MTNGRFPEPAQGMVDAAQLVQQGLALHRQGRLDQAEAAYLRVLDALPEDFSALHLLGIVRSQQGRHAEAVERFRAALKVRPEDAATWSNLGASLLSLGHAAEALEHADRALAHKPGLAEAHSTRGGALKALGRREEAVASFDRALAINPGLPDALAQRGETLSRLGRFDEAIASLDAALAIQPDNAVALTERAGALFLLKRMEEALAAYDRALAVRPRHAETHCNRGAVLAEMKRLAEALASYDRALEIRPDLVQAHYNRGPVLSGLKRLDEAIETYERALAIKPDHPFAFGGLAQAALLACDWARTQRLEAELAPQIRTAGAIVSPFTLLGYPTSAALHLDAARSFLGHVAPAQPAALWRGERYAHDRIRVAYLSADFHTHATAFLMAELFERHDRSRFEAIAISYGPDDGGEMRRRLRAAFDRFEDVSRLSPVEAARLIRDLEVDIAVDLKGCTEGARPAILSHRPAPVQVSFLGFPGSMGVDFIDYIIADPVVLPFDQQQFYDERIVHLPDCYQPNDGKRQVAAETPTRAEAGLPAAGFVFCCFNNTYKVTAGMLDIWTRILNRVPGSVLWLLDDNATAVRNLRREAAARGLDPARLVFAPRLDLPQHMARHRLADLVLDTLPCNAHTTASDALWMGAPVLTRIGETLAGRVAASLLRAIELPELITDTPEAYEALAVALALEPERLAALKAKLAANRLTTPLFDAPRFTRNLEAAFTRMRDISRRGEPPRSFAV